MSICTSICCKLQELIGKVVLASTQFVISNLANGTGFEYVAMIIM